MYLNEYIWNNKSKLESKSIYGIDAIGFDAVYKMK